MIETLDAISFFKTTKQEKAKSEISELENFVDEMQKKIVALKQNNPTTVTDTKNDDITNDSNFQGGFEISLDK